MLQSTSKKTITRFWSSSVRLLVFSWAIASAAHADDPTWSVTSILKAPEAHQAAAANAQCVFAIASKVIAKYDRRSGARLAVSAGEAEHLNSGFTGWQAVLRAFELPENARAK